MTNLDYFSELFCLCDYYVLELADGPPDVKNLPLSITITSQTTSI